MSKAVAHHKHLLVTDRRSRFAAVTLGWRARQTQTPALRQAIQTATTSVRSEQEPVFTEWTNSTGALCVTAMLPDASAEAWVEIAVHEANTIAEEVGGTSFAAVGTADTMSRLRRVLPEPEGPPSVGGRPRAKSTLHRSTLPDHEQTLVIGQDPSSEAGAAATFLAICLVAAGPGTIAHEAAQSTDRSSLLDLSRGLENHSPTVTWRATAPQHRSMAVLETVLSAVSSYRAEKNPGAIRRAREFAAANLSRPWRSPLELSRSLVQYEVMGWGGSLILNPEATLAAVEAAAIVGAARDLVRPIEEVLGRS